LKLTNMHISPRGAVLDEISSAGEDPYAIFTPWVGLVEPPFAKDKSAIFTP
jgi:hypothetical protein